MTSTTMSRFSYVSALILFLLGIVNIVFAWKTHSYLYIADIKRQSDTKRRVHTALSMMALDRSPSTLNSPIDHEPIIEIDSKKPIQVYLLIKE